MKELAQSFAALADPTRLRLLNLMRDGEICVCFLQSVLKTNQPKISRHLAYLRNAGLVTARRDGKWMHYQIAKQAGDESRILDQVLHLVKNDSQARTDIKRLKSIQCCPGRYGVSSP